MEKEDELNIDLNKIKNFFKPKENSREEVTAKTEQKSLNANNLNKEQTEEKSTTTHSQHKEQKNSNDEISIDFSKIKDFLKTDFFSQFFSQFKSTPKSTSKDVSNPNDINFSKYFTFFKSNTTLIVLLVLLILQFVPNEGYLPWGGMWMRLQVQHLSASEDWARNAVHNFYRDQIRNSINQQYQNIPDENKQKLVEEEFVKISSEQKSSIDEQIKQTSSYFKSFFEYEHNGKNYLYTPDIDPYVFVRYARNYVDHGYIGDEIVNGEQRDNHQFAPMGKPVATRTLHPYIVAYLHKFVSFFNKDIPILQSTAYLPIIFSLLVVIPTFFIARIFGGNIGGFFAGTMISIHASFLVRTAWGHADTDAYNIFFPLAVTWLFLLSIYERNWKKVIFYNATAGFLLGLFSIAWGGWWYIFYFIISTMGLSCIYAFVKFKHHIKEEAINHTIALTSVFVFFTFIFVSIFNSFEAFYTSVFAPFRVFVIKAASHATLWPNVYTTVAELNSISFKDIIAQFGMLLLLISALGILFTIFKNNLYGKKDEKFAILLLIWFLATIYTSTKGIRFIMMVIPPFSIAFGIGLGVIFQSITNFAQKRFSINKVISGIVLLFIFSFIFTNPVKVSYSNSYGDIPIINDAWWNLLTAIKDNSNKNAIITSWWDFGHHFKYIADRPVTFDGGSQNTPMAHWVGKLLMTDNETLSIGILRLLDCSSDIGIQKINNMTNFTPKTVEIINKIVVENKDTAKQILTDYGISEEKNEEILKLTHCDPPEAFLITSDDMIAKAGVWAHFGSWNFERADIWINVRKMERSQAVSYLIEKYNHTKEEAEQLYAEVTAIKSEDEANRWIAPWPSFASGLAGCEIKNKVITCGNGFILENEKPEIVLSQGSVLPESYSFIDNNKEFKTKVRGIDYQGAGGGVSVMLIPTEDSYNSIFMAPPLEKSMFSRLFFEQGHGLKHYKLFKAERQITGGWIYIWKVDWKGGEPNIMDALNEKEKIQSGDTVIMNYIGWLDSGEIFDSSIVNWKEKNFKPKDLLFKDPFAQEETSPLKFKVGEGRMIPGMEKALLGMERKEHKIIKVKPEEAYGTDPSKHPLGNKTLNFLVKIESIK